MSTTILKVAADYLDSLLASVNAGDTTATLTLGADADGTTLAAGTYGFTIDNNSPQKEYIIATVSGGVHLTGILHANRDGSTSAGFSSFHRKGAVVEITDWSALFAISNNLGVADQFDPAIHLGYSGAPTSLVGNDFATVTYVLSVVSGGTVLYSQQVLGAQTAGENLTANDHVYFKESDHRWYKVDADLTTTYQELQRGIALATVTTGNTLTIGISGPMTGFTGLSAGAKYYASNTAGAIQTSVGTNTIFVGWALSTTSILFSPYGRDIPYGNEKDALAGSVGTPSSSNLYITQAGTSAGATDQSQLTQTGTFSAGEANATTRHNKLTQSFVPAKTIIKSINLYKSANTGTFTGTVSVAIQADSAGSPSGVDLASKTITNAFWLAYATGDFMALFSLELTVTPGNLYWIVISTSTADTSNCINIGTSTAGGYASGSAKYNNTADGWVVIPTIDLYFKVNEGFSGKAIDANSSGFVPVPVSKIAATNGSVNLSAGSTTAIAHGLGKVPAIVEAMVAGASTVYGTFCVGRYAVAMGTYISNGFVYNEGTSGSSLGSATVLLTTVNITGAGSATVTITAVDENVVIFSTDANASGIVWQCIA